MCMRHSKRKRGRERRRFSFFLTRKKIDRKKMIESSNKLKCFYCSIIINIKNCVFVSECEIFFSSFHFYLLFILFFSVFFRHCHCLVFFFFFFSFCFFCICFLRSLLLEYCSVFEDKDTRRNNNNNIKLKLFLIRKNSNLTNFYMQL